jgi:hypothetical protein
MAGNKPGQGLSESGADIDLPPPGTRAWGSRKKAAVVLGIRGGLITRDEAYAMYMLSPEELASWEAAFDQGGHQALIRSKAAPRTIKQDRRR